MRKLPPLLIVLALATACGQGVLVPVGQNDAGPRCGDGVVQGNEECDLGAANGPGLGCENDCTFTCIPNDTTRGDVKCDPHEACKGKGSCTLGHRCELHGALPTGAACGAQRKICNEGACIPAVCGDGLLTAPEECDDGVNDGKHGCGPDCQFSCVAGDPARSCASSDPCRASGVCDGPSHVCTEGAAASDGTPCGGGKTCKTGVCTGASSCGNGVVDNGEQCDFGASNGHNSGCEVDCKFSCTTGPDTCAQGDACSGGATCKAVTVAGDLGHRCVAGAQLPDGTACGAGGSCAGGVCKKAPPANCGNGQPGPGKDCDFGAGNGPGAGCETNCTFSCTTGPDSCPQGDVCQGTNVCTPTTGNSGTGAGQKCVHGAALSSCAACGTGGVCVLGHCRTSRCGDGCVDQAAGETCEPPGSGTCDAECHLPPGCGNGVREAGEDCDDGNVTNLDGCDSTCHFEQAQRINSLQLQWAPDDYCTADAIGGAVGQSARSQIQTALDGSVGNGSLTMAFKMLGLTDPTGAGTQALHIGGVSAAPSPAPAGVTYSGASDLDWWYHASADSLDAARNPTAQLAATLSGKVLDGGPGNLTLVIALGGGPVPLQASNVLMHANLGNSGAPLEASSATPGHLPSEHLNPALTSFATMANGKLCANISALSMASVSVPAAILSAHCAESFTSANTLLDVLVRGCTAYGLFAVFSPTQPDQIDPTAPAVGAGGLYKFSLTGSSVTGCVDKNGKPVDLEKCKAAAAYSSFFAFTTDRVILK